MTSHALRLTLILTFATSLAPGACVRVSSDRIVSGDLIGAVPLLSELPPDTFIGFAPFPGTERVISGQSLIRIAAREGLTLTAVPDLCVERGTRIISKGELETTLRTALGIEDAQVEILEFSSQPLPPGRLEFQRSGLNQPPDANPEAPVLWRGRLLYEENRSLAIWAKVRITLDRTIFLATEDIPAGATVRATQLKAAAVHEFPYAGTGIEASAEIIGKLTLRRIRAGQRITAAALEEPKDVARGDLVQVRIIDGSATLSFDGIAVGSGRKGDVILVHNAASGRNFRALVEEKGKAVVRSSPGDLE
jgi:flagella basal body P-ring formation protein FlgA